MNPAILLICAAVLLSSACSKQNGVVKRAGQPDYVTAFDEKLMGRAIQKAKDTKQDFIAALQNKPEGAMGFAIKKPYPTPKGGEEHIWLNEVSWDGKVFDASINDEPVDTKAVKMGERQKVAPEEISDWMYIQNGKLMGGYTIRVLHYQSSPEEQKEFLKHVPFTIPPIDF
jgi:uncharacterized protein YegJ (DUF2314 family)